MDDGESYENQGGLYLGCWYKGYGSWKWFQDGGWHSDTLLGLYTFLMVVFNVLVGLAHKLKDFRSVQISHVR